MPRTPRKVVQLTEDEAAAVAEALAAPPAPVLSRDELRQIEIGAPPER